MLVRTMITSCSFSDKSRICNASRSSDSQGTIRDPFQAVDLGSATLQETDGVAMKL